MEKVLKFQKRISFTDWGNAIDNNSRQSNLFRKADLKIIIFLEGSEMFSLICHYNTGSENGTTLPEKLLALVITFNRYNLNFFFL